MKFLMLILTMNLMATEFNFQNKKFEAVSMGSKVFVYESHPKMELALEDDQELDCEEVKYRVRYYESTLNRCQNGENTQSYCDTVYNLMRRHLDKSHYWSYEVKAFDGVNQSGLIAHVARTNRVSRSNVELISPFFNRESSYAFSLEMKEHNENSLTAKTIGVVPLPFEVILLEYFARVRTDNTIVACDLMDGLAKFDIKVESTLRRSEEHPREIVLNSYDIYRELLNQGVQGRGKVQQAAYMGYIIGKGIEESSTQDLDLADLFNKFTIESSNRMSIRGFNSRSEFQRENYPTMNFSHRAVGTIGN